MGVAGVAGVPGTAAGKRGICVRDSRSRRACLAIEPYLLLPPVFLLALSLFRTRALFRPARTPPGSARIQTELGACEDTESDLDRTWDGDWDGDWDWDWGGR